MFMFMCAIYIHVYLRGYIFIIVYNYRDMENGDKPHK